MGLYEKIEEIRSKPEHIRIRYVWFMVFVSMVCIIFLWWFSFKSKQVETSSALDGLRNSEIIPQLNEQKESLKTTVNETKNVLDTQIKKQKAESQE
jgi:hypothetical protein